MKRKFLFGLLGIFLTFFSIGTSSVGDVHRYPVMRPDSDTMQKWMIDYETAPRAFIDPNIRLSLHLAGILNHGTSRNLLGNLDYVPADRNQGGCGNCWAWAGTGVMEIAHSVQDGVFDRLSLQYINSCRTEGFACCGGGIGGFAEWYAARGMAVPWDNPGAAFVDGARGCADGSAAACDSITTVPNYPITSITATTIETHSGQANAIANIKNVLNQDKAIYFWFGLPDGSAWGDFFDFWDCLGGETEASLCGLFDDYCGQEWDDVGDTAGSHAILIYGYNDDDPDPANHYWLALNSWGNAGGRRLNGFVRIPMNVNYDCTYEDSNNDKRYWAIGFQTLDVTFGDALPVASAGGPYSAQCGGATTSIPLDGSASLDLEGPLASYSWTSTCPGASFNDPTSPTPTLTVDTSNGCAVNCKVALTVTDGAGQTDTAEASVTVSDTTPPVILCPPDITVECTGSCGVQVGDPQLASFFSGVSATDACDPSPALSNNAPSFFGIGTTSVLFKAKDYCGNSSTCEALVTVVDTTAPQITLTLSRNVLWPARHNLITINATVLVSDVCDPDAGFVLTSITSDEPDDGLGDGDMPGDIQGAEFGTADTGFQLRAERSGLGSGRTYTVTYTASDTCGSGPGNPKTATAYVFVPHDLKEKP